MMLWSWRYTSKTVGNDGDSWRSRCRRTWLFAPKKIQVFPWEPNQNLAVALGRISSKRWNTSIEVFQTPSSLQKVGSVMIVPWFFSPLFTLPETNSKSTWKWMVGIRSFPFEMAYFRGYVSLREGTSKGAHYPLFFCKFAFNFGQWWNWELRYPTFLGCNMFHERFFSWKKRTTWADISPTLLHEGGEAMNGRWFADRIRFLSILNLGEKRGLQG